MQKLRNLWIGCCSAFVLASCAAGLQQPPLLVKDTFGDECAAIKVPLPLASKVFDEGKGHQSIHIWRVGVTCRLREVKKEGSAKQLTIENLEVQLVMKGFVENTARDGTMDVPIVILVKDDAHDVVPIRLSRQVRMQMRQQERTIEESYRYAIPLRKGDDGLPEGRIYPTIYVAMDLETTEWQRYRALIEKAGERALLPSFYKDKL